MRSLIRCRCKALIIRYHIPKETANIHKIHKAVNDNTDGIRKHMLSPYNAHYLYYNFLPRCIECRAV